MNNSPDEYIPRIIGKYSTGTEGPLLFITAGVHGNEPSGVKALQEVFGQLEKSKPNLKGTVVGVAGNQKALNQNKRYLDQDLNRVWKDDNIEKEKPETHEQAEMKAIIKELNRYPDKDFTDRYFLDCHTTSSPTLPYLSVQDVNKNDQWAHQFPTYIVRGFSDIVSGTIDHYLSRLGLTGFVLEAGQHEDKSSVENHEGVMWLALRKACGLDVSEIETYPDCVNQFAEKNAPDQKTFELIYRHGLENEDVFTMEPGYNNFQEISKGELLATQNGEEVRSKWDARIFMPLYQSQGNDGFFVIEEVSD